MNRITSSACRSFSRGCFRCGELLDDKHQLVLISHHPEILSNSGEENGRYLWRDNHTSPTRIGPLKVPEGMGAGEAIARGWARGE